MEKRGFLFVLVLLIILANLVSATDIITGKATSSNFNLTIVIIEQPLNVFVNSPANIVYTTSSILFDVYTDTNFSFCVFSVNEWLTNYTMAINSSASGASYTLTMANALYTARFSCNDSSGGINNSESVDFRVYVEIVPPPPGGGGGGEQPPEVCSKPWTCSEWSKCMYGEANAKQLVQKRTCECGCPEESQCSGEHTEVKECVVECEEDWVCGSWGACVGEVQKRECLDLNNCGTVLNEPEETTLCGTDCTEDWICDWGECSRGGDRYSFDCIDLNNCGTVLNKPYKEGCEEFPETHYECREWGECKAVYSFEDIVRGEFVFNGTQGRVCEDVYGNSPSKLQARGCLFVADVETKKVEWCEENYVEVYEKEQGKENKLISRIKEEKAESLTMVDINFVMTEFKGYCNYCFDGIKDYDETDADCGGPNCPACLEKEYRDTWPYFILFLWLLLLIVVIIYLVYCSKEYRKKKLYLGHFKED